MIKQIKNHIHPILLILLWLLFIFPVFLGKTPFPSTYQVNFFSPWSSYPGMGSPVKNNAQPDIIGQIYPWRYFSIQELKQGRLPLWNPYSFAGTPHVANYQSAAFFPLNILFFLPIKFIDAWSALVLLQPLMAGLFTYLLTRKLKISPWGSLISAASFMFCGFLVSWLGYATLGYAILPLPLAMYSVLRYVEGQKLRWIILLSLTFPLSYFAGHFQTSLYFTFGIASFICYQAVISKEKKRYMAAGFFSIIGLFVAMPQILPSLELYSLSYRSGLFQKFEAIPLQYLTTLFSPDFFGNPVTRNDWFGHYAEWNGFAGVTALSFAVFTVLFYRNRKTMYFILLAILSLLFAFDTPILNLLVALKLPVISTSAASRIIVLFSFSIAVLSGFGLDAVIKSGSKKKQIVTWSFTILALFISLFLAGFLTIHESDKTLIARKNSILPLLTLLILIGSVVSRLFLKNKKASSLIVLVLVFVCFFEMHRFASKWQNFDPKKLAYIDVPVANFYNAQNHYDRAIGMSGGEDAVYYQMPILSGYDPLYKAEYGEFMQYVGAGKILQPERSVVNIPLKGKYTHQALDFLGVHYVVHKFSDGNFPWAFPFADYPLPQFTKIYDDSHYLVFRNNNAFERAFVVSDIEKLAHQQIPEAMFDADLKTKAFIEESVPSLDRKASGSAKIERYLPTNVMIKANTTGKLFLILTDNFYPGWKVKVNGEVEKLYKTNYSFRGVVVPKGESKIEFYYQPMSFMIGIYMALVGLMSMVVYWVLGYMGGKK